MATPSSAKGPSPLVEVGLSPGPDRSSVQTDGRSGFRKSFLKFLAVLVAPVLFSCHSAGPESTGPMPPRPDDCMLLEAGPVYIPYTYRPGVAGRRVDTSAERYGFDRLTDVRAVYEMRRGASGTVVQDVLVGWEAVGWRWNNPACRRE